MKSFTNLLIASLLLTASVAGAAEEISAVSESKTSFSSAVQAPPKTFRLEASRITGPNADGHAVYLSYGSEFSIMTALRQLRMTKTYHSWSLQDFGDKELKVDYLEIPLHVALESPNSLFYSHMGLFYAIPQNATYDNRDAKSIVQSNLGFQMELGLRWQLKPLAIKLGYSTTSGLSSVTSDKSIENSVRSESAITAGLSFIL